MINLKSKIKKYIKLLVIRGPGTFGDPLLLFGEGMEILSSNSDGDGDICKISGMGTGRLVPSPPLPIAIPRDNIINLIGSCKRLLTTQLTTHYLESNLE